MTVLERSALAESPLADLHEIASELGVDGFRRLRRDDLIDAILARQGGEQAPADDADDADDADERPKRRRGGRRRDAVADAEPQPEAPPVRAEETTEEAPRRRSRGGRSRQEREEPSAPAAAGADERTVEGVVELQPNGSAFVRLAPSGASDDDVYVSAAQVRRCELVDGDRVSGPVRPPRRSERFASLVRIEAVNGAPADHGTKAVRFDELPAVFPSDRFALGSEDPTVKAIEWLTPIGRGSRVTIAGAARSGKSEALRRLAAALAGVDEIECAVVLVGVRPEELSEWAAGSVAPSSALSFAAAADAQAQAVER
ncbi:MAG: Rho termination factor N-terminal domain-containing protein, partial [Conexibacter sp.]